MEQYQHRFQLAKMRGMAEWEALGSLYIFECERSEEILYTLTRRRVKIWNVRRVEKN